MTTLSSPSGKIDGHSGQFEETIHKSNWVDLTASTFPHPQYQLPIAEVIEVGLPYTSSITEARVSLHVMDNKRQVASCCRYSIQPAGVTNRSVSISDAGTHTHTHTFTQSQKHYIEKPPRYTHTHTHTHTYKYKRNNHTDTHSLSHTGCVQGKNGRELLVWIGCGWGRSGLVHLISTGLILTVLTLTQAIHHVISPRWSNSRCVCDYMSLCVCHCVCVCVCFHPTWRMQVLLHIFLCAHVHSYICVVV